MAGLVRASKIEMSRIVTLIGFVLLLSLMVAPADAMAPEMQQQTVGDVDLAFVPIGDEAGLMDATGCNGNVCIDVKGSGLQVDRWETTAYVSAGTCTYARFLRDNVVIKTSVTVCPSSTGWLRATWHSPGTFPHGTQLCNTWYAVSGKPCITVKQ